MDRQMLMDGMVLIDDRGIIIMPEEMNDDCYRYMLELLMYADKEHPGEPISIFCKGDGGDANVSEAIVQAIMEHGKCVGVLNGAAISGHANTFIHCEQRLVMPLGSLHFHTTFVSQMSGHMDYYFLLKAAHSMREHDMVKVKRLAIISGKDESYWIERLDTSGPAGFTIRAAEIMALGIAKMVKKTQSWVEKKPGRVDPIVKITEIKT